MPWSTKGNNQTTITVYIYYPIDKVASTVYKQHGDIWDFCSHVMMGLFKKINFMITKSSHKSRVSFFKKYSFSMHFCRILYNLKYTNRLL